MTDDDFMRSMERYAAFAEEHLSPNMLVNVTRFRHSPGEQVGLWRDEHIIPRYNAAGVKKFTFLVPPGTSGTVEKSSQPGKEPPGEFPTGYFEDRQASMTGAPGSRLGEPEPRLLKGDHPEVGS